MKEADRREVPYAIIVGENEVKEKMFAFKNMKTGEKTSILLDDTFAEKFSDILMASLLDEDGSFGSSITEAMDRFSKEA